MGSQWTIGRDLMTLDCFHNSVMRSDTVLRQYGISLSDILMDSKQDKLDDAVNSFVCILGVQVIFHVSDSLNMLLLFFFPEKDSHFYFRHNFAICLDFTFMKHFFFKNNFCTIQFIRPHIVGVRPLPDMI